MSIEDISKAGLLHASTIYHWAVNAFIRSSQNEEQPHTLQPIDTTRDIICILLQLLQLVITKTFPNITLDKIKIEEDLAQMSFDGLGYYIESHLDSDFNLSPRGEHTSDGLDEDLEISMCDFDVTISELKQTMNNLLGLNSYTFDKTVEECERSLKEKRDNFYKDTGFSEIEITEVIIPSESKGYESEDIQKALNYMDLFCTLLVKYCSDLHQSSILMDSSFNEEGATIVERLKKKFDLKSTQLGGHAALNKGYLSPDAYKFFQLSVNKYGHILAFRGMHKETRNIDSMSSFVKNVAEQTSSLNPSIKLTIRGKPPTYKKKTSHTGICAGSLSLSKEEVLRRNLRIFNLDSFSFLNQKDENFTNSHVSFTDKEESIAIQISPTTTFLNQLVNKKIIQNIKVVQLSNNKTALKCQHKPSGTYNILIPSVDENNIHLDFLQDKIGKEIHDLSILGAAAEQKWKVYSGSYHVEGVYEIMDSEEFMLASFDPHTSTISIIVADSDLAWYVSPDTLLEEQKKLYEQMQEKERNSYKESQFKMWDPGKIRRRGAFIEPSDINNQRFYFESSEDSFAGACTKLDELLMRLNWNPSFQQELGINAVEHPSEIDTPFCPSSLGSQIFLLPGGHAIYTTSPEQFLFVIREIQQLDRYKKNIRVNINWLLMDISDEAKRILKDIIINGVVQVKDLSGEPAFFIEQAFYLYMNVINKDKQGTKVKTRILQPLLITRVEEYKEKTILNLIEIIATNSPIDQQKKAVEEYNLMVERYIMVKSYLFLAKEASTSSQNTLLKFPDELKVLITDKLNCVQLSTENISPKIQDTITQLEKEHREIFCNPLLNPSTNPCTFFANRSEEHFETVLEQGICLTI
ncbi:hypothetical protein ACD661_15060 [Legionella lytica]|uniref:SidE PDE domain-containing protein n=1 Tax=Legionella lytica TaxID=96232 RepID=A0ABW8DF71_9GAMM